MDDVPVKIDHTRVITNEQLASPALSPIAESVPFPEAARQNGDVSHSGASSPSIVTYRKTSGPITSQNDDAEPAKVLKLSPGQIHELTTSPGSLPLRAAGSPTEEALSPRDVVGSPSHRIPPRKALFTPPPEEFDTVLLSGDESSTVTSPLPPVSTTPGAPLGVQSRPGHGIRSATSPLLRRRESTPRNPRTSSGEGSGSRKPSLTPLKVGDELKREAKPAVVRDGVGVASPMLTSIPLPPLSLPTYLQLELSSERPSALYVHRPVSADFPYESSKVKFERLLNFLLLPHQLEQVLWFGTLACLDAWLYSFTILPLRFVKALFLLLSWWATSLSKEITGLGRFVINGVYRHWHRKRRASYNAGVTDSNKASSKGSDVRHPRTPVLDTDFSSDSTRRRRQSSSATRAKTNASRRPSGLSPNHKADLLHGLLIITSCAILNRYDASRMYHSIRGQAAIKLYVIYNVLEVCDRLFSALGQDVLECLFSKETLERKPNGRSKVIRPFWMFVLALVYNVIHATLLFYQVVTLNVAVNSYSNALLTLLMSNQFVEIKSTVFKKIEKENLFQLTCADVVERFQLWLMLTIIAARNIVEVGGLSLSLSSPHLISSGSNASFSPNSTTAPPKTSSLLPAAFSLLPSLASPVLAPFLIVLGSEMMVDWLKHAYVNKFNGIKPTLYGRFLDILAKDYYAHAFADQNLTKRIGLPTLPLACLVLRAGTQVWGMFVATSMASATVSTTSLSAATSSESSSAATTAALQRIDAAFRRAIGQSSFGGGDASSAGGIWSWTTDDAIAFSTLVVFVLVLYLFLLAFKLVLGMALLSFARSRYKGMKEREHEAHDTNSRRLGVGASTEVDEDKRRWIYEGDDEGLKRVRDREAKARERKTQGDASGLKLEGVGRYMMAAKRIW